MPIHKDKPIKKEQKKQFLKAKRKEKKDIKQLIKLEKEFERQLKKVQKDIQNIRRTPKPARVVLKPSPGGPGTQAIPTLRPLPTPKPLTKKQKMRKRIGRFPPNKRTLGSGETR